MISSATCASDQHTTVRAFAFYPLEWTALPGGSVWRCQELFAFIFALALNAQERECNRVAVITNYDRVRVALQAFITKVRVRYAHKMPESLDVLTPEEASGSNLQATIVLGGHRRNVGDTVWHGGHQSQAKRRYVALSRASTVLNILVEAPGQDGSAYWVGSGLKFADDYWLNVVRHCEANWSHLVVVERVQGLGWPKAIAREFAQTCREAYESVDWPEVQAKLRCYRTAGSAGHFFESAKDMAAETRGLPWQPQ